MSPRVFPHLTPELLDAGHRAADIINEHRTSHGWDDIRHKWLAIRISDGGYDGTLYDTRRDAVRHQKYEQQCVYISFRNLPGGARAREMVEVIWYAREAYKAGARFVDPEDQFGGRDLVMTTPQRDAISAHLFPRITVQDIQRLTGRR